MEKRIYRINNKWLLASIVGSIWASFEIVLGSFLHNIHFPMSGTLLTIIAGILMIIFAYQWQERGMILRAGIIAALMKSISPSAVLFGPMTAIFFEALIFEVVVFFLGYNWISYTIASIGLLYSVLIHKLLTWIILYGWNLVRITKNMYYFAIKQLNINNISFTKAFILLSLIYVVIGLLTSLTGIVISKRLSKENIKHPVIEQEKYKNKSFEQIDNENFSIIWLVVIFIYIILGFSITNSQNFLISTLVTVIVIVVGILRYSSSMRRFLKPGLWIQAAIFLLISIIFYNGLNKISLFNKKGFQAGMNMIYRMIILLFGFSALSKEFRNPLIKTLLFKKGLRNLYMSIDLAFSILPTITKYNLTLKSILKKPILIFNKIIGTAHSLFDNLYSYELARNVVIITGDKGTGKTTFAKQMAESMKNKNIKISGVLSVGKFENNIKTQFELVDIQTNEKILLASTQIKSDLRFGKFYFNKEAFRFGEKVINRDIKNYDYILIDEVGMLEIQNGGWYQTIENLFKHPDKKQIWVVRRKYIDNLVKTFGIVEVCIIDIHKDNIEEVINKLTKIY